jgi:hypothetical protein
MPQFSIQLNDQMTDIPHAVLVFLNHRTGCFAVGFIILDYFVQSICAASIHEPLVPHFPYRD